MDRMANGAELVQAQNTALHSGKFGKIAIETCFRPKAEPVFRVEPYTRGEYRSMKRAFGSLAFLLIVTNVAQADFPRASYEGAPNGLATPFAGEWSMAYAADENTIVAQTLHTCDAPIVITASADDQMAYHSPGHEPVAFETFAFEGRTTWYPESQQTSIAVWLDPDRFLLYSVSPMGKADWEAPFELVRCPE